MTLTVAVCRKCKNHECLTDILRTRADVSLQLVKCQKICHGPVVGLPIAGTMEWFERVDGLKEVAALVRLTHKRKRDTVPKPLRKRRVKKHSGRAPR
ncbi:MAG TPA: hypothetical protein VH986_14325 [Acidimicrobiia bacterium]